MQNTSSRIARGVLRGAGEEVRTLDIQLGKLTLYRLSYSRIRYVQNSGGGGGIRTHDILLAKQALSL
jgi:hypothetical protein